MVGNCLGKVSLVPSFGGREGLGAGNEGAGMPGAQLHLPLCTPRTQHYASTRLHFTSHKRDGGHGGLFHSYFIFNTQKHTRCCIAFLSSRSKTLHSSAFLWHQQAPEFMFITALGQMKHKTAAV